MKKRLTLFLLLCAFLRVSAQSGIPLKSDTTKTLADIKPDTIKITPKRDPHSTPFTGDYTWLNGNDRRHTDILDSKYFTPRIYLDVNYTQSNRHPNDNTVVGSTALARNNEFQISDAAIGGDFHYNNVRASIITQMGTRVTTVARNDVSVTHGQYDLTSAYKYFSEANAGYHFNLLHGLNVDAGTFMSYIGLNSYYNSENWVYQPSFTSDNTPWFFNGMRVQLFPTETLKVEAWLINGWQSYGKFNQGFGIGGSVYWRPKEYLDFVSNFYRGHDTQDAPNRLRVHSDNSVQIRLKNDPKSNGISMEAFSITGDVGYEKGPAENGVSAVNGFSSKPGATAQYFASGMLYHRMQFHQNHFGWTIGGGIINNPGRYLVLAPTGAASPIPAINGVTTGTTGIGAYPFTLNAGDQFHAWDMSTTLDWMPTDFLTFRIEMVRRVADVPYFAGPGGVTSPDGYSGTAYGPGTAYPDWKPDLVKSETRFIGSLLVRF